ncbi:uncharacterized protein LOC127750979 [Frankliniella occidentalis]|uniref:Uncharacterized protein LOC127750979 n=1 Tax=Frankliniella occidentalis TaxID=133901 RepID=A0A9C6X605_FRAOC|nr:uncharacterized protein LOC127750979 [Frankliniella occidentalis]
MCSEVRAGFDEEELRAMLEDDDLQAEFDSEWDYAVPPSLGCEEEFLRAAGVGTPSGAAAPSAPPAPAAPPPTKKRKSSSKGKKNVSDKPEKPKVHCPRCNRGYNSLEGVERHQSVHKMEDGLTEGLPTAESVLNNSVVLAAEVLEEMVRNLSSHGSEPQLLGITQDFIKKQKNENFVSFINVCTRNICQCIPSGRYSPRSDKMDVPLPSVLYSNFLSGCSRFLISDTFFEMVDNLIFEDVDVTHYRLKVIFCTDFTRKLLIKVVAFVVKSIKLSIYENMGIRPRAPVSISPGAQIYLKQCVHYVSGSVIRRILRPLFPLSRRNGGRWCEVIEAIQLQFLKDDLTGPHADLERWTLAQDRGSLLYVSESALTFFLYVAEVAKSAEQPDGSLDAKVVLQNISEDVDGMFRWDAVCGERFTGTHSQFLMDMAVKLFCSTWAKGIQKRRMNALHARGYISQNLRGKLAGASSSSM